MHLRYVSNKNPMKKESILSTLKKTIALLKAE